MNIAVNNNNILLDNKIVFTRKYPTLKIPNEEDKIKIKINKLKKKNNEYDRLPPPLWCTNERDGCKCRMTFRNPHKYNIHSQICLFNEENDIKEEIKDPNEDLFFNLDDDTMNILESYERMTGNNVLLQILLGQLNYKSIDNIINDYYNDEEYLYMCDEDFKCDTEI